MRKKYLNSRDRTNSSVKELSIIIFDATDFIQKKKGGGGVRGGCSAAQANVDFAFFSFTAFRCTID
jgi:hypothetical protein